MIVTLGTLSAVLGFLMGMKCVIDCGWEYRRGVADGRKCGREEHAQEVAEATADRLRAANTKGGE